MKMLIGRMSEGKELSMHSGEWDMAQRLRSTRLHTTSGTPQESVCGSRQRCLHDK
jgi:hypothetical protein